jgi:membrane protein implicated in regulation of membrane protease activity
MNVSRFVGGIICLVIAAFLMVLYFVLPADRMMFMVGDANVSWLPSVILGIVGVLLLGTAWQGGEKEEAAPLSEAEEEERQAKIAQNKRLESIGLGFFIVMLGGSILIPDEVAPEGLWTIGVGLIMLGLNAGRYYYGIRMSGFTTVLGLIALAVGTAELLGYDLMGIPFLLIIMGVYLLLKPFFDRRKLFGKAEES